MAFNHSAVDSRIPQSSDKVDCLMKGYLLKEESRSIGGSARKRYWFVLSAQAPFLFWYKSDSSVTPLGKINLASAAFTYHPANKGVFEVRCSSVCHILQARDDNERLQWLSQLQAARRNHTSDTDKNQTKQSENASDLLVPVEDDEDLIKFEENLSTGEQSLPTNSEDLPILETAQQIAKNNNNENQVVNEASVDVVDCTTLGSQFYLTTMGDINDHTFNVPQPIPTPDSPQNVNSHRNSLSKVEPPPRPPPPEIGNNKRKKRQSEPKVRSEGVVERLRQKSVLNRLPSFNTSKKNTCENCTEFMDVINQLKVRNSNLQDELTLKEDIISSLRNSVLSSKTQIEAMKDYQDLKDSSERTGFILDQVSRLSHMEQKYAETIRRIKELNTKLENAELEYSKAQAGLESYKEALRSKEEVVMKLMNEHELAKTPDALEVYGLDLCEDAVLIAGNDSKNIGAKLVLPSETEVNDMVELERAKDLINGYQNQNQFLNKEIIDLQCKLQATHNDLDRLQDMYYEKEAECFQKKSKIVLLLNHLQQSTNKEISAEQMSDLLSEALSDRQVSVEGQEGTVTSRQMNMTDNLGFYIFDSKTRSERTESEEGPDFRTDDLLTTAAQFKKQSDQIQSRRQQVNNVEYETWLDKWDSFLVNTTDQPGLEPSEPLKILARLGVPSSYRPRVWNNLVLYWTQKQQSDVGQGYYETQLRKSLKHSTDTYDQSLKQIDIDLTRTLPGNKYFDDPAAGKIESLRHILYAFRAHNPQVGYCQGLNRLGACALLYLNERDAFWFLVACVEHLQPITYYTQEDRLCTVQADLKVLQDLISEKLSRLAMHFRNLQVDLTMFSVSWFMTIFVDSLSHDIYLCIFDAFLTEGNKVLFRFALAILKICENDLLACDSSLAVHSCLNRLNKIVTDYKRLAHVAFKELNPFPRKHIESRRIFHQNQLKAQFQR